MKAHKEALTEATRRVLAMDEVDGGDRELKTICAALEAATKSREWVYAYDALYMLTDRIKNEVAQCS